MKRTICKLLALALSVLLLLPTMVFAAPTYDEAVKTATDIWDGSIADGFAGGTGTEDDPFLITNGAELAYLGYTVNVEHNRYTGQYLKLANDIYLNDTTNWQEWGSTDANGNVIAPANEWTAIGIYDNSNYPISWPSMFEATFDGDGHFVSGIYINNELEYQGLFGFVVASTIKNVGVIDSYINAGNKVGGIVGGIDAYPSTAYVLNCYNYGTIIGKNGGVDVGGIAGAFHGTLLDSCFNMGTISGGDSTAGIAGTAYLITNCFNGGEISLSGGGGTPSMGGIAGYAAANIENCYNVGTINAEHQWCGGIVGWYDMSLINCYYLDTCGSGNEEGTSLTAEQMQDASSFFGFDFDTVWTMDGDADYPYPELINTPLYTEPASGEDTDVEIWDGSIADGFAGGTGTEDDPYLISNGAEFAYLAYTVNEEYNRYEGQYFKLTDNIYLNDTTNWQEWGSTDANGEIIAPANTWAPIGILDTTNYSSLYDVTFDGDGHFVSGVYVNNANDDYQGLFGFVAGGTIKNVGVIESYIKGYDYVGAIVGGMNTYPRPGYIYNCYNYGTVSGFSHTAGIVGETFAPIDSCFNMGTISGGDSTAGIAGMSGDITNCFNGGDLSNVGGGTPCLGGMVGYYTGMIIENCYNAGNIPANHNFSGALVGLSDGGDIINCYYLDSAGSGNRYGTALTAEQMQDAANFVGFDFENIWTMDGDADYLYPELINTPLYTEPASGEDTDVEIWDGSVADGFAGGTGTEDDPFLITNGAEFAYFAYTVNVEYNRYTGQYIKLANDIYLNDTTNWQEWGSTDANGNVIAPANEWTAIGIYDTTNYSSLFEATFDGDGHFVSGIYINNELEYQGLFGFTPCTTIKNLGVIDSYISGANQVGAIAGQMLAYPSPSYILNCYNYGTVRGWTDVGGIVGSHSNIIDSCFNMGAVTGDASVGGIVGAGKNITNCFNAGDVRLSGEGGGEPEMGGIVAYTFGTVENCYNVGTIHAESWVNGGIIGFNDGTLTNCYYLDTCGSLNEEGTSLTAEQMQDAANFAGFDFENIWTMDGDADYLYPELINTPLWTEPTTAIIMGDVDFSGEVLTDDALLVLRYGMGLGELTADQLAVADVNSDGVVNAIDALLILRMTLA